MRVIKNIRTSLEGPRQSVLIDERNGKIICLISGDARTGDGSNCYDGQGCLLVPAGLDPHVHFRVPGGEHKEDWQTGSNAALAGGITTVFDMPNTWPPLTAVEDYGIEWKAKTIGSPPIDFRFWFGATVSNFEEIRWAAKDPRIIGVKVYVGSSTGDLLIKDDNALEKIFRACAEAGTVLGVHAEDEEMIRAHYHLIKMGREPKVFEHGKIRDTETEVLAVQRALRWQRETGCRLYLCHISTPEALECVRMAKQKGALVYAEVSPHHLFLSEGKTAGRDGGCYKVNPPLRSQEQMAKLRRLVCENGLVDTIGSDHAPHTLAEKNEISYDRIPSGLPGVQTSFGLVFSLVMSGDMSLKRFCELTSGQVAKIFGLKTKGVIGAGYDADLVMIDPEGQTEISHQAMRSKCGWTPFDGMTIQGKIVAVFVKGKQIRV